MSRILSIDYGKKRTGLAVTDPAQIVANGLTTVDTHLLMDFLKKYVAKEKVECFVIGWPMQTNGAPSENLKRVKTFTQELEKIFPSIPIVKQDERFTSVLAHRTMIDAGLKKSKRQDKALVDEISATIILQEYLESKRGFGVI